MPGDMFTQSSPEDIARSATVVALRSITNTLEAMTQEMSSSRNAMSTMQADIAVIKVRQEANVEMRSSITALEKEIEILKTRNAEQDGAVSLVTMLKDFGPWIVSLLLLAWGLFSRKAG